MLHEAQTGRASCWIDPPAPLRSLSLSGLAWRVPQMRKKLGTLKLTYIVDLLDCLADQGSVEEQMEETFTSVETPAPTPFADEAAYASYHLAIICRTIIAAARGGALKGLVLNEDLDRVFAIRSLLPCWVRIESWGGSHPWRPGSKAG